MAEGKNKKERRPKLKVITMEMIDKFKEKIKESLWGFNNISDADILEIYFKKAKENSWI
ncbi:MAG: hypothetical protein ACTSXY_12355 [Promethearchaeota archaeon]